MLSVQFTINDVTKSRILYFTKFPLNLNLPAEVHVWSWYGATMLWTSGTCRDGQSVIGWKLVTWSKHRQVIGHCITHSWIPRGQLFCWVILGALKYSRSPKSSKLMKTAFSSTYLGYGTWLAHQSFFLCSDWLFGITRLNGWSVVGKAWKVSVTWRKYCALIGRFLSVSRGTDVY